MWRWTKSEQVNDTAVSTRLEPNGHHPRSGVVLQLRPERQGYTWRPPASWRWGRIAAVFMVAAAVGIAVVWFFDRRPEWALSVVALLLSAVGCHLLDEEDA